MSAPALSSGINAETLSGSVFEGYRPPAAYYDELVDQDGALRPQWAKTVAELQSMGRDAFISRAEQVRRIVQDNGVTYNAYGEPERAYRPWVMDPLPMILGHEEWASIEQGMRQRVTLFNRLLEDLYGEQRLLKDGLLPPSLVLGNPYFLRPVHGFHPPGGVHVHLYAADLARSPDGRWWVLSDRLETPSGIGYALENRFVTQRAMADLFRAVSPLRLRPFFQHMSESFETLVRRRTENPLIVLLSPGPAYETYFEHAFFARNLGYPLVEGADLTTRDQRVFLKTVDGLKQVDVIIRNVPSNECDPLELDADSFLGVPGLVQAARAGNVVVANTLGAGLVETAALPAFLPQICQRLAGEQLRIPSAATWWCGNPQSLEFVLGNMERLVFKPVVRRHPGEARFGSQLDAGALEKLREQILANPAQWCAQELVSRATVPTLGETGEAEPRHFLMRVFLVAHQNGYDVMPGALTRITRGVDHYSVSMAEGGTSKDTWVLPAPDTPTRDHPLPHTGPVRLRRSTADLTSRDADNLFWMGRYLERTDFSARLIRMIFVELRETTGESAARAILPFLRTALGDPELERPDDWDEVERRLTELVWCDEQGGGLSANIGALHRSAFAVKERLSLDASALLNQLERLAEAPARRRSVDPSERLGATALLVAGISGTIAENMTRALDWSFLELGRRIERAQNMIDLVQQAFSERRPFLDSILGNLLVAADSRYTYASRYLTNLQPEAVLDLLLLDTSNPRSVAFQAQAISTHMEGLPVSELEEPQTDRRRLARRVASQLDLSDVRELLHPDADGCCPALDALLNGLRDQLHALADLLARHYFAHTDENSLSYRLD